MGGKPNLSANHLTKEHCNPFTHQNKTCWLSNISAFV